MAFQERTILLIDESPELAEVKDIFESPLGLAKDLVKACFEADPKQGLLRYETELDAIKRRAAGVTRARRLSSYKIAEYSPYLFAFQQFFHSSYRARQGEVLEAVVFYSLRSADANPLKEKRERRRLVKTAFGIRGNVGYDVDFLANKPDRILLGQIRSTDVTGGTTAKGSLVDLLRFILREKESSPSTRYLIVVWEPLESQQKQSLINKIWDSLRSELGADYEAEFKDHIGEGMEIPETNISARLVYGIDEFGDELNRFAENERAKNKLMALWESIQEWDDLWLTYAIASLELENLIFEGETNFQILDRKLRELGITVSDSDLRTYRESSASIAERIVKVWSEDSLPVTAPSDILNYLRDLVLLKMIHVKVMSDGDSGSRSITDFV